LAYNLILNEFRKSCAKEYLDQIDKNDLTAFIVALKKEGQDDRTVANRVAGVVTFLRAHGIVNITQRHKYTEKKVKAYSIEELRALNWASTDEEFAGLAIQFVRVHQSLRVTPTMAAGITDRVLSYFAQAGCPQSQAISDSLELASLQN
jgi:Phage integrase, N-terminal SAM-like domain